MASSPPKLTLGKNADTASLFQHRIDLFVKMAVVDFGRHLEAGRLGQGFFCGSGQAQLGVADDFGHSAQRDTGRIDLRVNLHFCQKPRALAGNLVGLSRDFALAGLGDVLRSFYRDAVHVASQHAHKRPSHGHGRRQETDGPAHTGHDQDRVDKLVG